MLTSVRKIASLLDRRDRRRTMLVFLVSLATALAEVGGVASVMPFIAVLSNPAVVESNQYLAWAYARFGFTDRQQFLFALGLLFFLLLVGSLALRAFGAWVLVRFTQHRSVTWSVRLVRAYLRQPYEWFLNRHSADLASAVLQEVDSVVTGALMPAMSVVAQGLIALLLLGLLIAVNPVVALIAGLGLGLTFGAISGTIQSRLRRLGGERRKANKARFHALQEAFSGVKDIKVGGLEEVATVRFATPARTRSAKLIEIGLLTQLPGYAMQATMFGGMILMLLYLLRVHGSFQEALPIISVYALAGYRLMPAAQRIFEELGKMQSSEASLDRLAADFATLERSAQAVGAEEAQSDRLRLRHTLTLHDVHYTYPRSERPALHGITMEIPVAHSIGIVGSTGSGKTTTVDLILGLLRPHAGVLDVDGVPVTDEAVRSWQRNIGYVSQSIFLTDDTVAANIAFGVKAAKVDFGAVERAARIANLHEFVVGSLPDGYATKVGERGVRLSGGQRQRIGIARALYHDPDVLVLDEATSALDSSTERAVMEAMRQLCGQKTVIIIAHRLSTVRHCDRIYMLEQGRIASEGTYDELLASNDRFRQLAAVAS
jgi:ABC-type multidrug transport system fused ATPase/permease subunit